MVFIMILKHIECYPKPGRRENYLATQRLWNQETVRRERVGVYTMAEHPGAVYLLVEWPDLDALDHFMRGTHELLMREHPLDAHLRGYAVEHFEWLGDAAFPPRWQELAVGTAVIRHTVCEVPVARQDEFMQVQADVWSPGMAGAAGFLGGRIWRSRKDARRLLLVTFFASVTAHQAYRETGLPRLRIAGARSLELCTSLEGREIRVTEVLHRTGTGS